MGSEKSYVNRFNRAEVIAVAKRWASNGADVYISEKEGLTMGDKKWKHTKLEEPSNGQKRRYGNEEWITYLEH